MGLFLNSFCIHVVFCPSCVLSSFLFFGRGGQLSEHVRGRSSFCRCDPTGALPPGCWPRLSGKCFSIDDFHLCFPMKSRSSAGILSVHVGCLFLLVLWPKQSVGTCSAAFPSIFDVIYCSSSRCCCALHSLLDPLHFFALFA